jgi:hypothetical protein
MMRILKKVICLALGVTFAGSAWGFSTWGPTEGWQTQDLDYGIRYLPFLPLPNTTVYEVEGPGSLGAHNVELGGTKNFGQGSRLNVPVITYAYDYTFLSYFGAQGVAAIDAAFAVMNGLPNVSSTSGKLTEFITQGNQQVNYSAEAMRMIDLKSTVMWLLIEHMGLIGETHTYDLRERIATGLTGAGSCDFYYVVLQRNFDPITYNPSQYVNGTLLTYQIGDLCPGISVADAMEESAQAGTPPFSAVATREALQVGGYYLRITRDDMGGLRYLYRHNRYVNEALPADSTANTNVLAANGAGSITGIFNPINTNSITNLITSTNSLTNTIAPFTGLLGGVEKITYVKTPYDSLLGTSFRPRTNHYTIPWVTNGVLINLPVTRTILQPDIIFTAGDLTFAGPAPFQETVVRSSGFITTSNVSPGAVNTEALLVTPSVITPQMVVTFNNSGQVYYNQGTPFADQANAIGVGFIWGSFNGSTNAPIAFPTGASVDAISAEVIGSGPETTEIGASYNLTYNPVNTLGITNTITNTTTNITTNGTFGTASAAGGNQ